MLNNSTPHFVFVCQDSNFSTALELAVRFGKTLVIQEMDGVEPVLYPILRGDFISQGKARPDGAVLRLVWDKERGRLWLGWERQRLFTSWLCMLWEALWPNG